MILADRPDGSYAAKPASGSASAGRDLTWLDLRSSRVNFGETETAGDAYFATGTKHSSTTDRGVYRPGETVHLRAIVRGPDGTTPPSFPVRWQFRRPGSARLEVVPGQTRCRRRGHRLICRCPTICRPGDGACCSACRGRGKRMNRSARRHFKSKTSCPTACRWD